MRRASRSLGSVVTYGVATALLSLVALSGTAQATTPNVTLRASYSGTWTSGVSGGPAGCGSGSVTQPVMSFNLTSGVALFSQHSSASDHGCTAFPAYTTANASSFVKFVGSPFSLSKGNHTVATLWTVSWAAHVTNLTRDALNPPAACEVFSLSSYLEDSAGHVQSQNSPWSPGALCDNLGNVSASGVARFTIDTNVSLTALTHFQVVVELDIFTGAYISSLGNSASASFDVGTKGHYAKLDAVVIH